jgi:hypothetical protein
MNGDEHLPEEVLYHHVDCIGMVLQINEPFPCAEWLSSRCRERRL